VALFLDTGFETAHLPFTVGIPGALEDNRVPLFPALLSAAGAGKSHGADQRHNE
jgi:hypothetical protein